jgi:hypothetical protein
MQTVHNYTEGAYKIYMQEEREKRRATKLQCPYCPKEFDRKNRQLSRHIATWHKEIFFGAILWQAEGTLSRPRRQESAKT